MRAFRGLLAAMAITATQCLSTVSLAAPATPTIYDTQTNLASNTLTINGNTFGGTPSAAWLGSNLLTIQSWTDTQIVAMLPAGLAPGDYLVTVQSGNKVGTFVASIGTSGTGAGGTVMGVVSACGSPVVRTLVYIPGRSFVTFTGTPGSFVLYNVPSGTYDVIIEAPGQTAITLSDVSVTAGDTTDTGTTVVTDLNSTQNCGACGNVCIAGPNSTASCVNGVCQTGACNSGFADCNGIPADGCEVQLATDVNNCGACNNVCSRPNSTSACVGAVCQFACQFGFNDCDNSTANGCETPILSDPDNCGGCFTSCSSNNMATRTCTNGICSGQCLAGFADCNGTKRGDGCEINLQVDSLNCGACGNACAQGQV